MIFFIYYSEAMKSCWKIFVSMHVDAYGVFFTNERTEVDDRLKNVEK